MSLEPWLPRRANCLKRVARVQLVWDHVAVHDDAVGEGRLVDSLKGNGCRVLVLHEAQHILEDVLQVKFALNILQTCKIDFGEVGDVSSPTEKSVFSVFGT
jgi:hypothetical protein